MFSPEERAKIEDTAVAQFIREQVAWQRLLSRDDRDYLKSIHIPPQMSDYKPFDANGTMHVRLPKRYRQPRVIGSWHFRLGKWQIRIATNWPLFYWRWWTHRKQVFGIHVAFFPTWLYQVTTDTYRRGIWLGPVEAWDMTVGERDARNWPE